LEQQLYKEMAELNKYGRDIMMKYDVHSCTDITGFGLMGHAYEMASGSGMTIHLDMNNMPYHKEAIEMAKQGFIPAGAYRNRDYTDGHVRTEGPISEAELDILYDPQTSGGLMIAVSEKDAPALEKELSDNLPCGKIIGYVTAKEDTDLMVRK
jgi:selenide, water dikinase